MHNFDKKQKIILGIIVAIVVGFIFYYVYARDDNKNQIIENNLEIENTEEKEEEENFSDEFILVHVSGAVNKEGIVELKANSRISDAIDKSGGIREDANIEDINLAYKVEDGMKIYIPTVQEKEKENNEAKSKEEDLTEKYVTMSSGMSKEETGNTVNNKDNITSKVNINTATQEQLETLPGIGPATATKILNYRQEKGKFKKIEDIKEVSGIGDSKFEKIKDYIIVK